jgi:hypothetical protein
MTREQGFQLGQALLAWGRGHALEVRDSLHSDKGWYPFHPDSYEKITIEEGIEWRVANSLPLPDSKRDR